ncbi:hypothetical protein, partial [Faecalibaculum rodentium]
LIRPHKSLDIQKKRLRPFFLVYVLAMADEQVVSYRRFLILCPVPGAVIGFTINTETKQT